MEKSLDFFVLNQKYFSNFKVFFVFFFEDVGLRLGTLMYYGFPINIVKNFFSKKLIFFDLLTRL